MTKYELYLIDPSLQECESENFITESSWGRFCLSLTGSLNYERLDGMQHSYDRFLLKTLRRKNIDKLAPHAADII